MCDEPDFSDLLMDREILYTILDAIPRGLPARELFALFETIMNDQGTSVDDRVAVVDNMISSAERCLAAEKAAMDLQDLVKGGKP